MCSEPCESFECPQSLPKCISLRGAAQCYPGMQAIFRVKIPLLGVLFFLLQLRRSIFLSFAFVDTPSVVQSMWRRSGRWWL